MAHFAGYGYSDAFAAHMAALLEELRPESLIMLTVGTDAVCGPCPNNGGGLCNKPGLVASYDRAVLRECGLTEGDILPYGKFKALVREKILDRGLRKRICGKCQWDEICTAQAAVL